MNKVECLVLAIIVTRCTAYNLTHLCFDKGLDNIETKLNLHYKAVADTAELIRKNAYPVEVHEVQTPDNYILDVQRIPHGLTNEDSYHIPVLIIHGLTITTNPYVYWPPNLGYFLAEKGYDVWLGNLRGNFQNSRHIRYKLEDNEFWDYGFDEIALYDTPSLVDYVLRTTNTSRVPIITISMSTTTTAAMLALKPEYNDKVSRHIALAPVINFDFPLGIPFDELMALYKAVNKIRPIPDNFVYKASKILFQLAPIGCSYFRYFWHMVQAMSNGYSPGNYGRCVGVIFSNLLRGASPRTLIHFYQLVKKKQLTQYDFGPELNKKKYGNEYPPIVDFDQITVPTILIHSANDPNGNPLNVAMAVRQLKTAKSVLLADTMINHLDYVASLDANVLNRTNHKILESLN